MISSERSVDFSQSCVTANDGPIRRLTEKSVEIWEKNLPLSQSAETLLSRLPGPVGRIGPSLHRETVADPCRKRSELRLTPWGVTAARLWSCPAPGSSSAAMRKA